MIGFIKRMLERRRERRRQEELEGFRYMVRTMIEIGSPTVILETNEDSKDTEADRRAVPHKGGVQGPPPETQASEESGPRMH